MRPSGLGLARRYRIHHCHLVLVAKVVFRLAITLGLFSPVVLSLLGGANGDPDKSGRSDVRLTEAAKHILVGKVRRLGAMTVCVRPFETLVLKALDTTRRQHHIHSSRPGSRLIRQRGLPQ